MSDAQKITEEISQDMRQERRVLRKLAELLLQEGLIGPDEKAYLVRILREDEKN